MAIASYKHLPLQAWDQQWVGVFHWGVNKACCVL